MNARHRGWLVGLTLLMSSGPSLGGDVEERVIGLEAKQQAHHLTFTPDGKQLLAVVSSSRMGLTGLYTTQERNVILEVSTGKVVTQFGRTWNGALCVLSPDGKTIAYQTRDKSDLYVCWTVPLESINSPVKIGESEHQAKSIAWASDGKTLVSMTYQGECSIWDIATKKSTSWEAFTGLGRASGALAVSPDGKVLATAGVDDGRMMVRLWDPATGKELGSVTYRGEMIEALSFSPDGKTLAGGTARQGGSAVPGNIHIWDVPALKEVHVLKGHTDSVSSVAFTADGKYLLSGSYDGAVRVWDARAAKALAERTLPKANDVSSVAVSKDGKFVAVAGLDRRVRLWSFTELMKENRLKE